MSIKGTSAILYSLAQHNQWANQKMFTACLAVGLEQMNDETHGYQSVFSILTHLVQVEHSFFELAQGRQPQRIQSENLADLLAKCAKIDNSYLDYTRSIKASDLEAKRIFIPWFGFEITGVEGILQPLTHSHKHRSDVSLLLPRLGGIGIEMDFIRWIAEQKGQNHN